MWNKLTVTVLGTVALIAAQSAHADHRGGRYGDDYRGPGYTSNAGANGQYEYARVLSSEPITRRIRVTEPRRECYEETRYNEPREDRGGEPGRSSSAGSMILGGIIGAAIGNQFGRGDGRRAATAAGALIGTAIGHDAAGRRSDREQRYGYADDGRPTTVQHCDVRYNESWEERVEAYLVTYEYNGRRYTTRLPYDPGQQLRVNVSVRPDGG